MNNSSDNSVDEAFKSLAYTRLVETGERDRMMQHLKQQLSQCGWEEDLRKYCARIVRERGVESITLDELVEKVTPMARKNVPDKLKEENILRIRQFLTRELAHPKP